MVFIKFISILCLLRVAIALDGLGRQQASLSAVLQPQTSDYGTANHGFGLERPAHFTYLEKFRSTQTGVRGTSTVTVTETIVLHRLIFDGTTKSSYETLTGRFSLAVPLSHSGNEPDKDAKHKFQSVNSTQEESCSHASQTSSRHGTSTKATIAITGGDTPLALIGTHRQIPAIITPSPVQSGMVPGCSAFYQAQGGNDCNGMAQWNSIQMAQFLAWNPAVGDSCAGLRSGYWVCVGLDRRTSNIAPERIQTQGVAATADLGSAEIEAMSSIEANPHRPADSDPGSGGGSHVTRVTVIETSYVTVEPTAATQRSTVAVTVYRTVYETASPKVSVVTIMVP